jgi:hypothetical protein
MTVSKQTMLRVHMERFNLKKLHKVQCKEQYHIQIRGWFAALENFDNDVGINTAWGTI